ncbi:hypothetical protein Q9966_010350 [Columba livia]|nr:hypothetical protein Q9966_010350 [Columba livia]
MIGSATKPSSRWMVYLVLGTRSDLWLLFLLDGVDGISEKEKAKGSAGVTPLTPMASMVFDLQNRQKKRKPFLHPSPLQFLKVTSVQCCRKDYTS